MGILKRYCHSIYWGNPYSDPPSSLPRCLIEIDSGHRLEGRLKDKFYKILDRLNSGGIWGYSIGWNPVELDKPRRQWSPEAKYRNRRRRLAARLAKAYSIPQLFDEAFAAKVTANSEYYGSPDGNEINIGC